MCWVSRLKRKQEVKSLMLSTHLKKEDGYNHKDDGDDVDIDQSDNGNIVVK